MQVVVDSLLTSYTDSGKNDKIVVLLHGWADTESTFSALRESLSEHYRVISLDLPGAGGSEAPKQAWGLDEYSDFIAAFLQKIGAEPIFAIIGHSNGGAIAIYGLATVRFRTERLILLASAGVRSHHQGRKLLLKLIAKVGKAVTVILPDSIRQRLRAKLYKTAGSDMLVADHMQETFKKVVEQDVTVAAGMLPYPTLLIYGSADTDTPPAFGRELQQAIDNSRLEIIEGAGHFLHHEQPAKVLALVEEFLQS